MNVVRTAVRVLTWNLHAGIGPDGRYDLGRIVGLVQKHDPDIVALQEIDSRGRGEQSPFAFLAQALGSHAAEAKTIVAPDGYYGHALISRWPLGAISPSLPSRRCICATGSPFSVFQRSWFPSTQSSQGIDVISHSISFSVCFGVTS